MNPLIGIIVLAVDILIYKNIKKKEQAKGLYKPKSSPSPNKRQKKANKLRRIYSDVAVKRRVEKVGKTLNEGDPVFLTLDGVDSKFPGAISIHTHNNKWLGYLPKEVAQEIREQSLIDVLHCEVKNIWISNRGRFGVSLNLDGTQETYEKTLEFHIAQREPKESSKPWQVDGYEPHYYSPDIKLFKYRKQWDELEKLLIRLSDAARNDKDERPPPYYIEELGKLYFKQKMYRKAIPCFEEYVRIRESDNASIPKPILNQLARARDKVYESQELNV